MLDKLIYTGIVFTGFLAIMNPISGVPIFLTLTHGEDEDKARKVALYSVITAFVIVFLFALAGHFLLGFFGVSFTALRLAGGLLIILIGYEMLHGKQSLVSNPSKENIEKAIKEESSVAVTPLGIPLLAGPGVIITAMNFSAGGFLNFLITVVSFGILCIITYFVFISGKRIKKIMGVNALKVLTRMMGLVLIIIGTQMFMEGIYSAIQEFPHINNYFNITYKNLKQLF